MESLGTEEEIKWPFPKKFLMGGAKEERKLPYGENRVLEIRFFWLGT